MSTNPQQAQEQLNIFKMCGDIDLCLRKMKQKNIFIVGLSRSGKSTLFNNINNVTLMGVAPAGSQAFELLGIGNINAQFKIVVENAEKANSNSGIASVTLYPNILDKGEYTLSDMAGFMDTRRYAEVVGVSYVLKAAFQKVKQCQFVLVVMADYFAVPTELFRALKGFLKMFNFKKMSLQAKQRLFKSTTFAITKSKAGAPAAAYASVLKNFIPQISNPLYGGSQDSQSLTELLTYMSQHHEQYYLFGAAVINQKASPSTIVQDHFEKREYFQLQKENLNFQKQTNQNIITLPFHEDFKIMPIPSDKVALQSDLKGKILTVPKIAEILQSFFQKAIVAQNLLSDKLSFKQEFDKMKQFNNEYDVYSKQFNNRCEGIQQPKFPTVFSPQDPPRKLKIGIILAQNAFSLYKLFTQWPIYNHEDQASKLQNFMDNFRDHLIEIIKLFRNSFCSTYQEEQIILKFLFVAARTCRQFSMLYQIKPQGKHEMCLKLKDSFESIMQKKPLKTIQKQFVIELSKNIQKVCQKIVQNKEQAKKYSNYLTEVPKEEDCAQIQNMEEYKTSKRRILQIIGEQADSLQEALVALFENFIEHKKTAEEYINKMNDDEEENYPQHINFKFIHLLSEMGHKLLNLERADTYAEDLFAYERQPRIQKDKTPVKLKFIIEQSYIAMDIFIYIGDVDSVCKTYEVILKNIPQKDYKKQVQYLKGLALYCSKNGRIEQSITLYQKAMSICATGNLCKEFQNIKVQIGEVQNCKGERLKSYFGQLKHKKIIDPTDDSQLDKLTDDIEDLFIKPYKNKMQMQLN